MIDDRVLEDLLGETADTVAVPAHGAANVLAARDLRSGHPAGAGSRFLPGEGRPRSRRPIGWVAAAVVLAGAAALTAAVAGGSSAHHLGGASQSLSAPASHDSVLAPPTSNAGPGSAGSSAGVGATAAGGSGAGSPAAAPSSAAAGGGSSPSSPNEVPALQTKVIKTASADLRVPDGALATVVGRLGDVASADGGYVQRSTTSSASPGQPATANATLRIPVANFQLALDQVKALGTPTSVTSSGQDVTSQYVDLQARLQSLEDSRTQFRQILAQAHSIADILAVEQQIGDIQTQIEQLQGQLNVMSDQTAYSTITVSLSEAPAAAATKRPPPAPSGLSKAWAHARRSFVHGVESVVAASGGIAVFLLFATAAVVLGRVAWTRGRRWLL